MKKQKSNPLAPAIATVREKITETADTFSLRLSPSDPGAFTCRPGQFNMLGIPGYGEAPFSFSILDTERNEFVHTIRRAGNLVGALENLRSGQQLHFRGPYGNGWPMEKLKGRNVIVVAGGIGMAPLRPVMHWLLKNRTRVRKAYLLYGARTPADLLYRKEIEGWSGDIEVLFAADEASGPDSLGVHKGLVTGLFARLEVTLSESVTFTCGPQIMMKFVAAGLNMNGQNPRDIFVSLERRMKCGIGHCGHCQVGAKCVCQDGPVFCLPEIQRFADTLL